MVFVNPVTLSGTSGFLGLNRARKLNHAYRCHIPRPRTDLDGIITKTYSSYLLGYSMRTETSL